MNERRPAFELRNHPTGMPTRWSEGVGSAVRGFLPHRPHRKPLRELFRISIHWIEEVPRETPLFFNYFLIAFS
jgi:hypothetical protein